MSFSNTGTYTPVAGATSAIPGAIIHATTWNNIFTDLAAALTILGGIIYSQNGRVINVAGGVTILAADALVEITVSVSVINLPASSLKLWPVRIAGNAAGVFSTKNSVVTPNGTDKISGLSSLTLNVDYQTINLIPLTSGGWIAAP